MHTKSISRRRSAGASAFVALLLASPAVAHAQGVAKLDPLVEEAVSHHPAVRSAERIAGAAAEVVSREGSLPDPMLSGGVRNLRVDSPRLSSDPMSGVEIAITQDIPFPGKRARRARVASANADVARRDATAVAVGAALRVRQAYWRLRFAEEAERITREGVDILAHLSEITKARVSVGQAAQQDFFQAEVARGRAVGMVQERAQMLVTARRELNSAVGRPPETPVGPTEAPSEPPPLHPSMITAAAARANPELLTMIARATAASRAVEEARYDRWPDLQVGASYMFRAAVPGDPANGADMFSVGMGVTLPFWIARKQDAHLREARESLAAAEAGIDTSALVAATAAQTALDVVERLTREIALFEDEVTPNAEQAVATGTADYRVGKTAFVSLLQSWQALLDAQLDSARLRSERAQALAEIQALTGEAAR